MNVYIEKFNKSFISVMIYCFKNIGMHLPKIILSNYILSLYLYIKY